MLCPGKVARKEWTVEREATPVKGKLGGCRRAATETLHGSFESDDRLGQDCRLLGDP